MGVQICVGEIEKGFIFVGRVYVLGQNMCVIMSHINHLQRT